MTHRHNAWGQVTRTTVAHPDVSAVTTTVRYDPRGRRPGLTDPDRGTLTYEYNGFDEVVKRTDAAGHYQVMTYDGLGRRLTRRDYTATGTLTGNAVWTYDTAPNGLGQLQQVTDPVSGYTRTLTYDSLGRPAVTALTPGAGADTYYSRQTYDGVGRPYQYFDAARTRAVWDDNVTATGYNDHGYAERWVDGVHTNGKTRTPYRTITTRDARGNVTGETLGGGAVRTVRTVDSKTGRITAIRSTDRLGRARQDWRYSWDPLGNLTMRTARAGPQDLAETFSYDTLSRLTAARVGSGPVQRVTYDAHGNLTYKSDVGHYRYGADRAGPHAVTRAGDNRYRYDANGNLVQETRAGTTVRTLTYTPFNKVSTVSKGRHRVTFAYGPERTRYRRTDTDSQGTTATGDDRTTTTLYLGQVEKVTTPDGRDSYKRYVGGVALITHEYDARDNATGTTTRYLLTDHLGSLEVITDALGSLVQTVGFDPWGQRRRADTGAALAALARQHVNSALTMRGYSGHEMVDTVGLIHMNGRSYDPRLGRFLQADPVMQFPDDTQGHNRYSYVLNNPLAYIDPTGYILGKVFKPVFRGLHKVFGDAAPFVSLALLAIPGVNTWVLASWQHAVGFGFFAGGIATGSLRGALFGGISAAAFYATGTHFSAVTGLPAGGIGQTLAHGVTGGILAELQGGQFGHGFISAGLTKAVLGRLRYHDGSAGAVLSRTTLAAIVGGTVSRITGGKFANGALTAAMAQLFNAEASRERPGRTLTNDEIAEAQKVFGDKINYSQVRIIDGKFVPWQGDGSVMAPDGDIYWPRECSNLAICGGVGTAGVFIHEMAHVMQYQHGVNVLGRGFLLQAGKFLSFGLYDPYNFTYDPNRSFSSYNIEQQGDYAREIYFGVQKNTIDY